MKEWVGHEGHDPTCVKSGHPSVCVLRRAGHCGWDPAWKAVSDHLSPRFLPCLHLWGKE